MAFVVQKSLPAPLAHSEEYESERMLEDRLCEQLCALGYEQADKQVLSEQGFWPNVRAQIERLNHFALSDDEWQRLKAVIDPKSYAGMDAHEAATQVFNTPYFDLLLDGENGVQRAKNIALIDRTNWQNNHFAFVRQADLARISGGANRGDVTILINGLPLVHMELKMRGVALENAFMQISRYGRESFVRAESPFNFVQLFAISNGSFSRYYSNTTTTDKNGWLQTCTWANESNQAIDDLDDFARSFLSPAVLARVLGDFLVFSAPETSGPNAGRRSLLVMRPYQIAAAERIVARLESAIASNAEGTDAGGYVWHTTGSGKTLTSFKTAQLCMRTPGVQKVLFVVDRKDLDNQTMSCYEYFCPNSARATISANALCEALREESERIVVTTIQKLNTAIKRLADAGEAGVFSQRVVMIFDECHRSQFGKAHEAIVRHFKRAHLFGFTGTPIFAANSADGRTSEDIFGECLHKYTITNAIADEKVLAFKVNYNVVKTAESGGVAESGNSAAAADAAADKDLLENPERIATIAANILAKQRANKAKRFNSMLATSSISAARMYYEAFARLQADAAPHERLKIAVIYSFAPPESSGELEDENNQSAEGLSASDREFLEHAIKQHYAEFGEAGNACSFEQYFKDVSKRTKDGEIDILVVVGMFLTGFDAKCMNTLYVDKNLAFHALVQAYSRTNRIYTAAKPHGIIECYRDLEAATNEAMRLFGDSANGGRQAAMERAFEDYLCGYVDDNGREHEGYLQVLERLQAAWAQREDSEAQKAFTRAFSEFLRLTRRLESFSEFEAVSKPSEREVQDMQSLYVKLLNEARQAAKSGDARAVAECEQMRFEVEFLESIDIDVSYILRLIDGCADANAARAKIMPAVRASVKLAASAQVFEGYLEQLGRKDFGEFVGEFSREKISECARDLALAPGGEEFIRASIKAGYVNTNSKDFVDIKPRSVGLFSPLRESDSERIASSIGGVVDMLAPFTSV